MSNAIAPAYETGLIGAMLIDDSVLPRLVGVLGADDFDIPMCSAAFSAAVRLYMSGGNVDPVTVAGEMARAGYPDLGSREFIRDVMLSDLIAVNADFYAKGVRDGSRMRRIRALLENAAADIHDPDSLADAVMTGLYEIERGGRRGKAEPLGDTLNEFVRWVAMGEDDRRLDTGYPRIDKILRGMYPGNLVLLAARPSVGKSAMAAEIALRAAERGTTSVLFSCEMANMEIVQRYVSNRGDVDLDSVIDRSVKADAAASARAVRAKDEMEKLPLYLYDEPGITVADIRRTLQTVKGAGFAVVDYIQLMQALAKGETRNLEVAEISKSLKQIAREFGIPVMALSQLSRSKNESDEPGLNALRDSGSLEQDADKVLMLWRLSDGFNGELPKIAVKVGKNRMGRMGTVVTRFRGERMAFYETDDEYVPPRRGRQSAYYDMPDTIPGFPWGR